jgi:DNA-binding NarL/FixJ family response regulator
MPKRILVADDSELMRNQIRTLLELDRNLEICAEAENGLDAVRKTKECHPDLAVVDLHMPVMNGLEATQQIKKMMPEMPVLLFTLYDSNQIRIEGERAGADAVLLKAQGSAQLSRTIDSLLSRH